MASWRSLRDDQVLQRIDPRRLPRQDHRRALELVENRGALERPPNIDAVALIHRAGDALAVEPPLPIFAQRIGEGSPRRLEFTQWRRRNRSGATQAIGNHFERLRPRPMPKTPT